MKTIMMKLYWKFFNSCAIAAIILCVAGASSCTVSAMPGPTDNFAQNSMDSFDMMSMYDMGDYSMDQFYNNADDLYTVDALNDMNEVLFFGVDDNIYISEVDSIGEVSIYLPEYETAEPAITDDGMWSSGMNDFFCETDFGDNSLNSIDSVDISMLPEDVNVDLVFIEPIEMFTADIVFDPGIQNDPVPDTFVTEDSGEGYFIPVNNEISDENDSFTAENIPLMNDNMYFDIMMAEQDTSADIDYSMMESLMMEQNSLAAQEALEEAYQQAMEEAAAEQKAKELEEQEQEKEQNNQNAEETPVNEKTKEDYEAEFEYFISLIDE